VAQYPFLPGLLVWHLRSDKISYWILEQRGAGLVKK